MGKRFRHLALPALTLSPVAVALILVAVGAWLAMDLYRGRQAERADALEQALGMSRILSEWMNENFVAADYVLRDVLDRVSAQDIRYPDKDSAHFKKITALLRTKLATVPGATAMTFFDSRCLITEATRAIPGRKASHDYCERLVADPRLERYVQLVPRTAEVSHPVILNIRGVFGADGQLAYGATVAIDLDVAQKWLDARYVGSTDLLALFNVDGMQMARTPVIPELLGKVLNVPQLQDFLKSDSETASYRGEAVTDGRMRLFGLSKIRNTPFAVVVGFDERVVLAQWTARAWQVGIGYCLLVLFAAIAMRSQIHLRGQANELRRQADQLEKLAVTDPLTGAVNRRHLVARGEEELRRSRRYGRMFSVLMIDIDHFKEINDNWGHATGDRVLQSLVAGWNCHLRDVDLLGRVGGDEFAAILSETGADGAAEIAGRLLSAARATAIPAGDGALLEVTCSIGMATLTAADLTIGDLLTRADRGLYQAKREGRDRACRTDSAKQVPQEVSVALPPSD